MSQKENVTAGVCKLIMEAENQKIESQRRLFEAELKAQKALVDAEIKGIKQAFYWSAALLGLTFSGIQIFFNLWHP